MKRIVIIVALTLALAFSMGSALATNGYFLHGQGTTNKAMAGAGSALPQDALAAVNNPASAVFMKPEYMFSLALFNPNREYTVKGEPSGYPGTFGLTPGRVESDSEFFPMPAVGTVWHPSGVSAMAVSFVSHGGMNTDYRTSTFYGGDHTGVDLQQAFLNATYARKLGENHSVGITAIAALQRFKAQGLAAFGQFSQDPENLSNNDYDNSYGFGAKLGYFGQFTPRFSAAASYSPTIKMSEFEAYSGLFAKNGSFDIPASVNVGIAYKITEQFAVALDAQRIHFSDVDSVGNHMLPNLMQSPLGSDQGAGFGWEDVDVYKFGMQYEASPVWTLRAGYSHANQPIPSSEVMFNILAPGVIEDHLTAGFSRTLASGNGLNFALMYAMENSVEGPNPMEAPGQQTIELTMDEWEAEISYSVRF